MMLELSTVYANYKTSRIINTYFYFYFKHKYPTYTVYIFNSLTPIHPVCRAVKVTVKCIWTLYVSIN